MPDLTPETLAFYFISYVVFLFSTTCHEAAHALAAKIGGDETASIGGQVSLNPVPHIQREPWGMVLVPILSLFMMKGSLFGWASAPYDPSWERRHPKRAAWMALAGPATNYTLMLLAAIGLRMGAKDRWIFNPETHTVNFAGAMLGTFFTLNLLLGTFNLLPVPPLDGSKAIMLFMGERTSHRYLDWLRESAYVIVGILLAIVVFPYIYGPIEDVAVHFLLPGLRLMR